MSCGYASSNCDLPHTGLSLWWVIIAIILIVVIGVVMRRLA